MKKTQKPKNKKSYTHKFGIYFLLAFVIAVGAGVTYRRTVLKELTERGERLEAQVETARQENIKLTNEEEYFTSDAYIEKIAREQLGLVMPDEVVFKEREE